MKKLIFLFFIISLFSLSTFAQDVVTGQVIDENGDPIAGAIVRVKDNPQATMSDFNGNYSIKVPTGAKTLIFSFTGKEEIEMEVTGSVVNATLKSSDVQITNVVVTGLGIKRDEKKVGYAVTTVVGDDVFKSRNTSAMSSLSGKIPGVNITTASGAPGASTRVIFRGFSSLSGSNQPLYVVDGNPINNSSSGSTDLNGGTDFGNQANDINPDDIESISFLKGSAATAIYGNRAASGVIIITTKSGKNTKKGTEVTFNTAIQFSTPLRLPQFQNLYGQGIYGNWDQRENTSYGPKFDNKLHYWGHVVDGKRLIKPYSAIPDNVADFFEVGHLYSNSLSIAGGGQDASYRFSYSNVNSDGIMPYDKDWYNRNTVSFNGGAKLTNKITSEVSITYVNKKNRFVPTGQGGQSVYNNILQTPRDIPILELANIEGDFFNNDNYYNNYTTNPYWPLLMNGNSNNEDRVYGMTSLTYEFNPHLKLLLRVGEDVSSRELKEWRAKKENSADGFNPNVDPEIGYISIYNRKMTQLNGDFILTYVNNFGDFSFNGLIGQNLNQQSIFVSSLSAAGLTVPGFYDLSNTYETPEIDEGSSLYRLMGLYGNFEIGYKSWLTLSVTARNDWSSALPLANNSFFYPGVSLGWVFTDAFPLFDNIEKIFSYGKIRVSYGKTGKDTGPYNIYPVLAKPGRFPLPNGVNGFSLSDLAGNEELHPELTTEFEAGTDLRFVNARYRIDFTYYNRLTKDLIFYTEKAPSSGYGWQMTNLGSLKNQGIELLVSANLISKKKFDLNLSWNFSINRSEVIDLGELEQYDMYGLLGGTEHYLRIFSRDSLGNSGSPIGIFEISAPEIYVDDQGVSHPVVNNQGVPKLATSGYIKVGKSEYDFISGFSLEMSILEYISINTTVDWRKGGLMYSRTVGMTYFAGLTPKTAYNDRQPFIVPNSVYQVGTDEDGNPIYQENPFPVLPEILGGSANSYWDLGGTSLGSHELISKTMVKLRDLSVSFNVPKNWLSKTPFGMLSVGIIGNNLLLWTPSDNNFIDPEATTFGNDIDAEFGEFGASPSVRTIGFSLTLKF